MKKTADSSVLPISLLTGIPFGLLGGAAGAASAPSKHKIEGAARGAYQGYMGGTGLGLGVQAGGMVAGDEAPFWKRLGYQVGGGVVGGLGGLGLGKLIVGEPQWQSRQKFREELMSMIDEEKQRLREEQAARYQAYLDKLRELQLMPKIAQDFSLSEFAAKNPELSMVPAGGLIGIALTPDPTKKEKSRVIPNALTGLLTATGAVGGGLIGKHVAADPTAGLLAGGGLGGLVSYLAARRAIRRLFGDNEKVSEARPIEELLKAKALSDTRRYKQKHMRLRRLIDKYPDDFFIDSELDGILGVTHRPTGFKIHVPKRVIPTKLRKIVVQPDLEAEVPPPPAVAAAIGTGAK